MIALYEGLVPKGNDKGLLKILKDYKVDFLTVMPYKEALNLSDGKPGTFFIRDIDNGYERILCFSSAFVRKDRKHVSPHYITVYRLGDKKSMILAERQFGPYVADADEDTKKKVAEKVRKVMRKLALITSSRELVAAIERVCAKSLEDWRSA